MEINHLLPFAQKKVLRFKGDSPRYFLCAKTRAVFKGVTQKYNNTSRSLWL